MAQKWADYLISKVKYEDTQKNKISDLEVHLDKGEKIGKSEIYTKNQVIKKIESDSTFFTIYKEDEKYKKGEKVEIVNLAGSKYLRTDRNETKKDNLGQLPEFS